MAKKSLRGIFKKNLNPLAQEYTASISFDQLLYRYDIAGSIAHAKMLAKQKIITEAEAKTIISGLVSIQKEIEQGKFIFKPELEDIHMNIEARLFEKVGDVAGKLHTARSRNDQVVLDLRLFVKEAIAKTIGELKNLQRALLDLAEGNKDVIMPGYTHLQRAQPVLLAHHVLAYFEMFQRDTERFHDCLKRVDVLPLGSGALAGVPYPIDRDFMACELGFAKVSNNSMDAVSDRDFVIEYQAVAAITMMHLSRLAEEIILWSSSEFNFLEIDDTFATGSSIMPQKKNPDVAELARGKVGRVYGNLMGILTTMKALPLTYNRDIQEDKEGLFDTINTLLSSLKVFSGMLRTMKVNKEQISQATDSGYILATDLADYLVKKGVPFREAHSLIGEIVQYAVAKCKGFHQLSMKEFHKFSPLFDKDVYAITVNASISARSVTGGTAPEQVKKALERARMLVGD